jgi:hypothetical protein
VLPLNGERKPRPLLQTPFDEWGTEFSPDGPWIAYASNESGRPEVYVRAFPDGGKKQQVSTDGGSEPVWARNGRELFYRNGDAVLAVPITADGELKAGSPKLLFQGPYESVQTSRNYDVTPDGQRFLMLRRDEPPATQVSVILNWAALLKR